MKTLDKIDVLRRVSFLADLDAVAIEELSARVVVRNYAARQRVVSELEFGCDVYVIARGQAEVFLQPQFGERQLLDTIGPGFAFGEMSSLTGELRSATVRAVTPLEVLVIKDADFDALRIRRPEIAVTLTRVLAERIADSEQTLRLLLSSDLVRTARTEALMPRSSLRLLWRELVVNHQKDLAFLSLMGFVCTVVVVRGIVFLSFALELAPRQVLRAAYVSGFGLVMASACASLLTFRPSMRRAVSLAFGIGSALIVNELGVTLAFDIFYKDIFTPDPSVPFDIERLYRRTEPVRALAIGLALLFQAVYLRAFYARVWYFLRLRVWRLLQ